MASVEKLPSGKWRATAYLGRDISGKKIRKTFTAETKWQALKLAEEYKDSRTERPKGMTVGDAIDGYIAAKTNVLSPTSISSYKQIRRGWSTSSTLKAVYQHTFSDERKKVNDLVNNYFSEVVHTKVHKKNKK